jgi:hypothetical protein
VPRLTRSRVPASTAAGPSAASQMAMGLRLQHDTLIADVVAGRGLGGHLVRLTALMTLASAAYGAVLGLWHGPLLASYVAVKFPLVMIVTSAITLLLSYVLAHLLGLPLRIGQVAVLIVLGLSSASVLLASLAPVAWLFTLAAPLPSSDARTAHNWLYLMHTAFVGGSGLAGSLALRRGLRATGHPPAVVARVYLSWVLAYAFVGGEVAWALRPFVGSVYFPVVFLRDDALSGNVYEFIVTDILPYLLSH